VLATLAEAAAHADVKARIDDPNLTADQLYGLFASVASQELGADQQNFLRLLVANDRLALLPHIHLQFEALKNAREGVVDADIASAFPLENQQLSVLLTGLEQRFKRKIHPRVTIDPELIGGVRIAVGDEVIDGSVRGKLAAMASGLLKA
jgi:F-type H+-transporting ATPase subunit delta